MPTPPRGRFAPSPTGRIHLGTAAAALLCWLANRAEGGRLVLRIEDNDLQRSRPDLVVPLLDDLDWIGLDWDEGPRTGGTFGPYIQSQRGHLYQQALRRLAGAGLLYACECSRADRTARGALRRYDGHCRDRGLETAPLIGAIADGRGHLVRPPRPPGRALRLRVGPGEIRWTDSFLGPQVDVPAESAGDTVLVRADGMVAYQLAVVVDDGAMAIDQVVRGADLLDSVGRQVVLQRALGLPTPRWGHTPILLGAHGKKLSKRLGDPDLDGVRAAGLSAADLVGWLAWVLGLRPRWTPTRPQELVADFSPARVRVGPIAVDGHALLRGLPG